MIFMEGLPIPAVPQKALFQPTPTTEKIQSTGKAILREMDSSYGVIDFSAFICALKDQFHIECDNFKAGCVATFSAWQRLANDPQILSAVAGARIDFASLPNQLQSKTYHFPNKIYSFTTRGKIVKRK